MATTVESPKNLRVGASVRFEYARRRYTGEVVEVAASGILKIKSDTPVVGWDGDAIPRHRMFVTEIDPLQRFAEGSLG